jgi:hypothetical protein
VSSLAGLCHYGNSGNGILRGPHFRNLDFSLFKNFPIRESVKLQFRAEFFNIFNSPNFNPPVNSLTASTAFLPSTPSGAFPNSGRASTRAGRSHQPGSADASDSVWPEVPFLI